MLFRLAQLGFINDRLGRPATADLIERRMLRRANVDGLIRYLQQGGVPQPVIDFVLRESLRVPPKLQKWLAYKLRDEIIPKQYGNEPVEMPAPEEMIQRLQDMQQNVITVRDWAFDMFKVKGFDINRFRTFEDALASAQEWHEEMASHREDGDPRRYKYPDFNAIDMGNGFRMVQINPADPDGDLDNEGSLMGHCVGDGGYDDPVADGSTEIWSLRDPEGYPHTTIELTAPDAFDKEVEDYLDLSGADEEDEDAYGDAYYEAEQAWQEAQDNYRSTAKKNVAQIRGKEDKPPIDRYRPYLLNWLRSQSESGRVDVADKDFLTVTPSPQLLQMAIADPTQFEKVRDHIDPAYLPEVAEHMLKPEVRQTLTPKQLSQVMNVRGIERTVPLNLGKLTHVNPSLSGLHPAPYGPERKRPSMFSDAITSASPWWPHPRHRKTF